MKTQLLVLSGLLAIVGCGNLESPTKKLDLSPPKKSKKQTACDLEGSADQFPISDLEAELMAKASSGFGERNADLCSHRFEI